MHSRYDDPYVEDLLRALRPTRSSRRYGWGQSMPVHEALQQEGMRFEFVQAMRLVLQLARTVLPAQSASADTAATVLPRQTHTLSGAPEGRAAAEQQQLSADPQASALLPALTQAEARARIRLRSRVGFNLTAATVRSIRERPAATEAERGSYEIVTNLLALAGVNAPLPASFAEMVLQRQADRDVAMTDFLDMFHQRLLELYYDSTLYTAPWLAPADPQTNEIADCLYSLLGLHLPETRGNSVVPDRMWLAYAGLVWHRPRSAVAFAQIVRGFFQVPARVGKPVGRWMHMEPEDRTLLSRSTCRLSRTATLGSRVWLNDGGVELHLGPMPHTTFLDFLPGGLKYDQVHAMAAFFFEDRVTLDLHLSYQPAPGERSTLRGKRLGWTSVMAAKGAAATPNVVVRAPAHKPSDRAHAGTYHRETFARPRATAMAEPT